MQEKRMVISALVSNHAGVLGRVVGLFSRRGFNIDSLTACACEDDDFSRITIAVKGDITTLKQITRQFMKLEEVKKTMVLDPEQTSLSELLLIKVTAAGDSRAGVLKTAQIYGAKILDIGQESVTLELTGPSEEIDAFIQHIKRQRIREMARTGITALGRGDATIKDN